MSEVPEGFDLGQELRRKSFEALQYLVSRVRDGILTEEQFNTGVDTLFMAVSGLVPELPQTTFPVLDLTTGAMTKREPSPRFIDVITACQNEIEHVYPVQKTVLFSKAKGVFKSFRWQAGDSFVDCTTCMPGADPTTSRIKCLDAAAAMAKFKELQDSDVLRKFGFAVLP